MFVFEKQMQKSKNKNLKFKEIITEENEKTIIEIKNKNN